MSREARTIGRRSQALHPGKVRNCFLYRSALFGIEPTKLVEKRVTEATGHVEDELWQEL